MVVDGWNKQMLIGNKGKEVFPYSIILKNEMNREGYISSDVRDEYGIYHNVKQFTHNGFHFMKHKLHSFVMLPFGILLYNAGKSPTPYSSAKSIISDMDTYFDRYDFKLPSREQAYNISLAFPDLGSFITLFRDGEEYHDNTTKYLILVTEIEDGTH
jgi:hypothetical protein